MFNLSSAMKSLGLRQLSLVYLTVMISFTNAFEPITTSVVLGLSAIGGYKFFDQIKQNTYCRYSECCLDDEIPFDIMSLRTSLKDQLYGQHIIEEKLFQAVASHYKEIHKSQKPLVMSFHGNYTSILHAQDQEA